jgi:hypothetical protein
VDDFLHGSAAELERVAAEIEAQPRASFQAGTRVIIDTLTNAHAATGSRSTFSMPTHGSSMSACHWSGGKSSR